MPALEKLDVYFCGLSTLFTCSAFTNLKQLKVLTLLDCPVLEEIVEEAMDEEIPSASEKTISLFLLKNVSLQYLPILKSFSGSSSYAFNMPALKSVSLYGCPCMDKFTTLQINVPLLDIFNGYTTLHNISDLNSYVREEVYGKDYGSSDESDELKGDGFGDGESGAESEDDNNDTKHGATDAESSDHIQELVTESVGEGEEEEGQGEKYDDASDGGAGGESGDNNQELENESQQDE